MERRKAPKRTLVASTTLAALTALASCGLGSERGEGTAVPATPDPDLSYPVSADFFSGAIPLDCYNRPQSVVSVVDTEPGAPHKHVNVFGLVEAYRPDGKPIYSTAIAILGIGALKAQVVTSEAPEGPGEIIDLGRGPHAEIFKGDGTYDIAFSAEVIPHGDERTPAVRYAATCAKPLQPLQRGDDPHYGSPSQPNEQHPSLQQGYGPLRANPTVQ